jgi:hypothetical protein
MKFIETILQCSQIKEAKLYGAAKKAAESPETGVIIQKPAAFHVIRDCATLAYKYLPHYVFGHYANPFEVLKDKLAKRDIEEFLNSANSDIVNYHLLTLIIEKIKKSTNIQTSTTVDTQASIKTSLSTDDPYGDYETYSVEETETIQIDNLTLMCRAFNVPV